MTDEILIDLVGVERLVAVTTLAADPSISNVADRISAVPHRMALNVEQLVALSPDLLFVAEWSSADSVRQLRDAGIPVNTTAAPTDFAGIRETIRSIGRAVGEEGRAEALIAAMDGRLDAVVRAVAAVAPQRRLSVLDYSPGGTAFGRGSSWDEVVRSAGLVNAVASIESDAWGNVPLSQEKLISLDPDIVVLPGWAWGDPGGAESFHRGFVADPAFRGLRAVRDGRVMLADERHRLATSHHIVAAVEDLAAFAYPELFR